MADYSSLIDIVNAQTFKDQQQESPSIVLEKSHRPTKVMEKG